MKRLYTFSLLPVFACASALSAKAEEPAEPRIGAIKEIYERAINATQAERVREFRNLRDSVGRVIDDYPTSEAAVDILLRREFFGLDLKAMDYALIDALGDAPPQAQAQTQAASAPGEVAAREKGRAPDPLGSPAALATIDTNTTISPAPKPEHTEDVVILLPPVQPEETDDPLENALDPATEAGEAQLGLSRQDIREVQARLTAIGIDPRGIDGIIGPGTRGAIRTWQKQAGLVGTGYLDAPHLDRLLKFSQSAYDTWRSDAKNRAQIEVVAVTPTRMSGTWRFSARCGSSSRFPGQTFTGSMTIRYAGSGSYQGTARNSQGLRGQVSTRVTGRSVENLINWGFLVGKVRSQGRISDDARSFSGRDSNGCRVYAAKQ